MVGQDYLQFRRMVLEHSAKGSTWKDHKYIKKENGKYYYPKKGNKAEQPKVPENISKHLKRWDSEGKRSEWPIDRENSRKLEEERKKATLEAIEKSLKYSIGARIPEHLRKFDKERNHEVLEAIEKSLELSVPPRITKDFREGMTPEYYKYIRDIDEGLKKGTLKRV